MHNNKAASWKRFPIGELARKRKRLKESYVEADVKCGKLQSELDCVQKDIDKLSKRVRKSFFLNGKTCICKTTFEADFDH
jgi:hypothetical protein